MGDENGRGFLSRIWGLFRSDANREATTVSPRELHLNLKDEEPNFREEEQKKSRKQIMFSTLRNKSPLRRLGKQPSKKSLTRQSNSSVEGYSGGGGGILDDDCCYSSSSGSHFSGAPPSINTSNMGKIEEEQTISEPPTVREVRPTPTENSLGYKLAFSSGKIDQRKSPREVKIGPISSHHSGNTYPSLCSFYAEQRFRGSSPREVELSLAARVCELELQLSKILKVVDNHLCLACGSQLEVTPDPPTKKIEDIKGNMDSIPGVVGAGGDCNFTKKTRSSNRLTPSPSPGTTKKTLSRDQSDKKPQSILAPTGLGAYKQLFNCIDYRYLPAQESAALSCELLHHMLANNSAAKLRLERAFESARLLEMSGSTGLSVSRLDQILYHMGLVEIRVQKEVVFEMVKELGLGNKSRIHLSELTRSLEEYKLSLHRNSEFSTPHNSCV